MIKMFSGKYWIILISACCASTGIILACADGWGEEYGVSNFSPEIFVANAYSPFFYSWQFYYGIGHDDQQDSRFNNNNVGEWKTFLQNQLPTAELQYLLEKAGTAAIDSAEKVNNKNTGAKKLQAFFAYLRLAKEAESFSLNNLVNRWDYQDNKEDKKPYDAAILNKKLQAAFIKTTDPFLKERYWFQLERSYFFNNTPQQAIVLFSSNEKTMVRNTMYYRTMAYAAGAYYKLKKFSQANYYFSKVYDSCDELKTSAHYSFHPQEEGDWKATLALCTSNNERITLWQMLGIFYADEQRAISEIYQLNPASEKLDLLLARVVNKYEQRFNHSAGNYMDMPADSNSLRGLPALVSTIAGAANNDKPWVWQMAAGYLATLDGKFAIANNWFAKAEKIVPATKPARAQLRLLKMINTISQAKRIDGKLESQLLNDINWLKDFDAKEIPTLRYTDALEWLKQQMAQKYRRQNDLLKAECFNSKPEFYASNKNVEGLKAFFSKKDKTPYENLCASLSAKKIGDLFEFQAISLTYSDSLDAAVAFMEKAGAGAATILRGNPFNGRILDCHDCDHEAAQKIKYSKLSFLKKIQEIKSKINKGEDIYTNAVLLANAHYNITHFGNARVFYEGKVLGESHSDPYFIDSIFRPMLTGTAQAIRYYNLALGNAVTEEQRARCQYMLAKCQRNEWYNSHVYNKTGDTYSEETMVDIKKLDGFRALKQYAHTQYYKDVIKECGYFQRYIQKK